MSFLVAIVMGFASGVGLRSLFSLAWEPIIFALLLAVLFFSFAFLKERRAYMLGAVFCLLLALGMVRAHIAESPLSDAFVRDVKHRVTYEGAVVSDPDVRDANQRVQIRVSNGGEETTILAVAPRFPEVMVGDTVRASGSLAIPEPFADDGGRIFRYDKYLERDGVRFILNFAYLRVVEEAPRYSIPAALARVKHSFADGLAATLPEPHASLASGIVIGGKSGLGTELKADFTRSGLIHMVVLSGHNVMIVATWVMIFFGFLFAKVESVSGKRLRRGVLVGLGALALILFVGIAGASATAIRAALMALIALFARATGRTYAASRALLFVVLLMLIWNPLYLVFDPGFGLSVAATAGLIWLAPIIEASLSFLKSPFWKEVIATTLGAQIFVLPLLLFNTGNLSLVSIPANLIVMPVIPLAMAFSALAGFAGMLFGAFAPLLGIALAFPAYLANGYLVFVAERSAAMPFAAFTLPLFSFWLVVLSYAALIRIAASKRFSTTLQLRLAKNASI